MVDGWPCRRTSYPRSGSFGADWPFCTLPTQDADVGFGITVCTFFLAEHRRVIVLADLILKRHPRHEMRRSVMAYQALALLELASYKDALVMFRHLLIEQGHLFINLHEVSAQQELASGRPTS